MVQGKSFEFGSTVEDVPLHQQRRKRDVSQDKKCKEQTSTLQSKEKSEGFHYEVSLKTFKYFLYGL